MANNEKLATSEYIEVEINSLELDEFLEELRSLQLVRTNLIIESNVDPDERHDQKVNSVRLKDEPISQHIEPFEEDIPMVAPYNDEYNQIEHSVRVLTNFTTYIHIECFTFASMLKKTRQMEEVHVSF